MAEELKDSGYTEIKELLGLEPVRVRPGMYIGDTSVKGLHHMIWEIVDNSIDEAMAGYASRIIVTITKDGSIMVDDDGRGIPVNKQESGLSGVELALCKLHAGGKFGDGAYKVSGGLHGVGASVVNALSKWMKVWVKREDKVYFMQFDNEDIYHLPHNGHGLESLKQVDLLLEKKSGTTIEFFPDFTVMEHNVWDDVVIAARLKELAYLNKGIKIILDDQRTNNKQEWMFEGGLKQYVEDLNKDKNPLIPQIIYGEQTKELKAPDESNRKYNVMCEVAFQYNKNYVPSVYSFCNNIHTTEGGTHEEGFRLAIVRIVNKFALDKKLMKEKDDKISKDDILEGLTAIISVKHPNPQYKGQTKGELGNSEVRPFVNDVVSNILEKFFLENPEEANTILKKILFAKEARIRSQEAREATRRKSPFDSGNLPGKLTDCEMKDNSVTELYIVEGDSAGGSAKQGRDHAFQAILPIRGKILNVEKAKTTKIFENEEINALINAIGVGVKPEFDMTKLRYDKVVIMTDADVDGAHIRILLLTFFFRYLTPLIEQGHVYAAQPPLYKYMSGKISQYAYSDEELEKIKKEGKGEKFTIQRYKGLGEMDAQQLWETTMDPEGRILHQVTIDDAIRADQMFSFLMGDDVQPRKDFISQNAKFVKNLDV
ncbi:MAG: DNA topoisomerase (ATP-hydrolyzing) subunit B [Mycoplasmataceae bacterium]|nr:DNA topoisomerase (ATP-hydrolyzing) subunit B [Mycoplasmataceae bacterium]